MAAEVDERLVLHERPGGGADVDHRRAGPEADLPPRVPRATAPVDVLVVDEEPLVERADRVEARAAHQQKAAAYPVDVGFPINGGGRAVAGAGPQSGER